jgi:hypothetical protein
VDNSHRGSSPHARTALDGPLFVSCLTYELTRRVGVERSGAAFVQMVRAPDSDALPAARTVSRLTQLGVELELFHGVSSCLPKARSRAATAALASGAAYWLMCDDDVEAPTATLVDLINAAGPPDEPRISVLPCLVRGSAQRTNCEFRGEARLNVEVSAWVRPVSLAGCGLMVVTRAALDRLFTAYREELGFTDDDGQERVALFNMLLEPPRWYGEDYSFCRRADLAGVPIDALVQGVSTHDGQELVLDSLR